MAKIKNDRELQIVNTFKLSVGVIVVNGPQVIVCTTQI